MFAYSSRPPDPVNRRRPLARHVARAARERALPVSPWLRHPHRDAYWKHGSVCEDFRPIEAAVLCVGGWNDAYSNAVPRSDEGPAQPCKAIIGPWAHKYPHFAVPEPRIGFLQEALRWWDFWLKGEPTGVTRDPPFRVYVMNAEKPEASRACGPDAGSPIIWGYRQYLDPAMASERRRHWRRGGRGNGTDDVIAADDRPRWRRILHHLARQGICRRPEARR